MWKQRNKNLKILDQIKTFVPSLAEGTNELQNSLNKRKSGHMKSHMKEACDS